jgi:hypothetical protein
MRPRMPMIPEMRNRISLGVAAALLVGVLSAVPASAAYTVESITFPGGNAEFYSPFTGPATVTFSFLPADPDATFEIRLRPLGGTKIHWKTVFIDPDTQSSPRAVNFAWPALSVTSAKTYQVAVYRGGVLQGSPESFLLRPKLVSITSIKPNPFLPLIDDGVKDNTRVTFNLQADADTEARVYRAKSNGTCCGSLIRTDALNNLSSGSNEWLWDGKTDGSNEAGLGSYFVRTWADDGVVAPSVSAPKKVTIARYYREAHTLERNGIGYHHTGSVTVYRRGGNCFVTRDETDKDLWITCLSARFTVYWRWSLPSGGRIESVSFGLIKVSSNICGATKGHTTTDSFLKVGGVGQFRCRVDKARIVYSVPVLS